MKKKTMKYYENKQSNKDSKSGSLKSPFSATASFCCFLFDRAPFLVVITMTSTPTTILFVLVLLVCFSVAKPQGTYDLKQAKKTNLPLSTPARRVPFDPSFSSSSYSPAFSYYYYCMGCTDLEIPDETDVYSPNTCTPTNYTKREFFQAQCSSDNSQIIITYYSDENCESPLPTQDEYTTEQCILPPEDWEAISIAHCRPKAPVLMPLVENYYSLDDTNCESEPLWTILHVLSDCVKTCPNSYEYGVANTTAETYSYVNGCEPGCPPHEYCGVGRYGKLNDCAIDDYTLFPRKVVLNE